MTHEVVAGAPDNAGSSRSIADPFEDSRASGGRVKVRYCKWQPEPLGCTNDN